MDCSVCNFNAHWCSVAVLTDSDTWRWPCRAKTCCVKWKWKEKIICCITDGLDIHRLYNTQNLHIKLKNNGLKIFIAVIFTSTWFWLLMRKQKQWKYTILSCGIFRMGEYIDGSLLQWAIQEVQLANVGSKILFLQASIQRTAKETQFLIDIHTCSRIWWLIKQFIPCNPPLFVDTARIGMM
jgi:hypothetical protein